MLCIFLIRYVSFSFIPGDRRSPGIKEILRVDIYSCFVILFTYREYSCCWEKNKIYHKSNDSVFLSGAIPTFSCLDIRVWWSYVRKWEYSWFFGFWFSIFPLRIQWSNQLSSWVCFFNCIRSAIHKYTHIRVKRFSRNSILLAKMIFQKKASQHLCWPQWHNSLSDSSNDFCIFCKFRFIKAQCDDFPVIIRIVDDYFSVNDIFVVV